MGAGMAEWNGSLPISGSRAITRSTPGPVGFYINCGDVLDAIVVEWRAVTASPQTPSAPGVTLTADHAALLAGETVTLQWTSTHAAACRASQGVSGDGWSGAIPVSGTRAIAVSTPGNYTWAITCEGAPPAAQATVAVTFNAAQSGNPGGGSGNTGGSTGGRSGGGGSTDPLVLLLLAIATLVRWRSDRRKAY
jgi:hypothetical protein